MESFLRELPKCEHHVHLEGTLEPDLLFPLAKRNNIELPDEFPATVEELNKRYEIFADLQDFLDFYYIGTNVLIHEEDFFDLAWAYFEKAKKDGLWHCEVFFDPQSHTERDIHIDVVVNGFKRACEKAEAELGITTKLIMCLLRHLPSEHGISTIHSAQHHITDGTIHALGLDSSEKPFPPHLFTECYSKVKEINPEIQLTAHAGEEGGADFVTNSLDLLNVSRIDHGVNSIQDPELMKRLSENRTLLTVCPLSNVKLQVVKDVAELPLQQLLDANVPFSLNSDDPAYFGGYILDNYITVHTRFGWSLDTWGLVAKNSINGSWCSQERKDEILEEINQVVEKYRTLLE
jgi:adenosine deaminase